MARALGMSERSLQRRLGAHGLLPGTLVTAGPYARLRHPLYTGLVLALAGHLLRGPSRPGAIALLAAAVAYASLAAAEDDEARQTFGAAWERYAAATRVSRGARPPRGARRA